MVGVGQHPTRDAGFFRDTKLCSRHLSCFRGFSAHGVSTKSVNNQPDLHNSSTLQCGRQLWPTPSHKNRPVICNVPRDASQCLEFTIHQCCKAARAVADMATFGCFGLPNLARNIAKLRKTACEPCSKSKICESGVLRLVAAPLGRRLTDVGPGDGPCQPHNSQSLNLARERGL